MLRTPPRPEQIDSSPKGLIGLGIFGAELGLVIPAAAGLDDTWALVTFPLIGAGGGAVAGHYLIDNNNRPKLAVSVLVVGLALVVPSLVLTLALRAYDPDDAQDIEEERDEEIADEREADAEDAGKQPVSAVDRAERVARAGDGLLRIGESGPMLGVPGLSVVPTYTPEELALFGGRQTNELRLSLLSGAF